MFTKLKHSLAVVCAGLFFMLSAAVSAGPVIIGGDDLTDHGSVSGGVNLQGWKYIELAITDLNTNQTRAPAGGFTSDIAVLGSSASASTCCDAGAAIGSAANVAGLTVSYYDGAAAINQFFTDLANGAVNHKILWIAGTGASNDLVLDEGTALTANAAAINSFVTSGGGLMAHGSGTTAFGWLTTLLPGIDFTGACQSSGATLTAAGQSAFPGLSNSDIDSNAGPCHNTFSGNFGGLQILALDGQQRALIIGGGGGTIIQCGQPGQPPCPTGIPVAGSLPLLAIGLLGAAAALRRRRALA